MTDQHRPEYEPGLIVSVKDLTDLSEALEMAIVAKKKLLESLMRLSDDDAVQYVDSITSTICRFQTLRDRVERLRFLQNRLSSGWKLKRHREGDAKSCH